MELKVFLFSLITIYVGARVLGELASRLGQSAVLGELLAGVLLGGSVLGWVEETETLKLLGEVGVMLLLFEVGLIFAGVGLSHQIIRDGEYGAILVVVVLTTLLSPIMLKLLFQKS